jgi:multidrug efflux pump subunit AcrA (membrane-fusion protein)
MQDDEITESLWYSTEGGRNIGQLGIENGFILRDEEFGDPEEPEDAEARITLEQGRIENPGFFVTAQLYGGWLFVTVSRATLAEAEALYDTLRAELERLAALMPYEGEGQRDVARRAAVAAAEAAAVEARYTTL